MTETDVEPGIELVMRVFRDLVAPGFSEDGIASFAAWANDAALAERLRRGSVALVAVRLDRLVGVTEWIPPDHLAMLFVDPSVQGLGIGRRLFEESLREARAAFGGMRRARVHASRYAVPFYRRLGFHPEGPETESDGIRYTPMSLVLGGPTGARTRR